MNNEQFYEVMAIFVWNEYQKLLKSANKTEKLIVLYHDAITMIENPPPIDVSDQEYLKKMLFVVSLLKEFKVDPIEKDAEVIKELFMIWFTDKNQGNNKEAMWAYKYMQARGFL